MQPIQAHLIPRKSICSIKNLKDTAMTNFGSQVKSLISFAISNASTNKDEPSKLPKVIFIDEDGTEKPTESGTNASDENEEYIKALGDIRNVIKSTHTYKITLDYANTGLIGKITINFKTD